MKAHHLDHLHSRSTLSKVLILFTWMLFVANAAILVYYFSDVPTWRFDDILLVNGFSIVIWTVVTFFSGIVQMYAANYMKGFKKQKQFLLLCLGFSFSVMLFVAVNHVALMVLFWFLMGAIMSKLIGINNQWKEAQSAAKFARTHYFSGALAFAMGIVILVYATGSYTRTELLANLDNGASWHLVMASLLILVAAVIQSAIFPFHRWLLSAMTSPTPASALMHAGFVNGAGVLLTLFAPLLFKANILLLIFFIGGVTAIIAQFSKLLQVNVKQKLACSTIAQMGFMVMQCGLGFFSAAVTHLILHGFYKAYLFLTAGSMVKNALPKPAEKMVVKPLQSLLILISAILGGVLFGVITGKGITLNSGLFLTFIVAITVGQVVYNIINHAAIANTKKLIITPILIIAGVSVYALIFNGVTLLMQDMPMANTPIPLTPVHIVFGVIFLIAFYIMLSGVYRKIPWLYVKLMNISQPLNTSVISFKSK